MPRPPLVGAPACWGPCIRFGPALPRWRPAQLEAKKSINIKTSILQGAANSDDKAVMAMLRSASHLLCAAAKALHQSIVPTCCPCAGCSSPCAGIRPLFCTITVVVFGASARLIVLQQQWAEGGKGRVRNGRGTQHRNPAKAHTHSWHPAPCPKSW